MLVRTLARGAGPRVLAHPVHAGPDARRHHRHGRAGRGRPGRPQLRVSQGPDLRQRGAGRRDQPRHAQDAERACWKRCKSTASPWAARRTSSKSPTLVLATQNPLEMEGTYPLPEAQLDRFFFKLDGAVSLAATSSAHHRRSHDHRNRDVELKRRASRAARFWRCRRWCAACRSRCTRHGLRHPRARRRRTRKHEVRAGHREALRAHRRFAARRCRRCCSPPRSARSSRTLRRVRSTTSRLRRDARRFATACCSRFEGEAEGISSDEVIADILKKVTRVKA